MNQKIKRQTFVVVVMDKQTHYITKVIGPYRSFNRAEGYAKSYDGTNGQDYSVSPIESED